MRNPGPGSPHPGPRRTAYQPADVLLMVEVVSPDSQERDRKRKLYAEADTRTFGGWRTSPATPPCTSMNSTRA